MIVLDDFTCSDCICARCSKADNCDHCLECEAEGKYSGLLDTCRAFHMMKYKKRSGHDWFEDEG